MPTKVDDQCRRKTQLCDTALNQTSNNETTMTATMATTQHWLNSDNDSDNDNDGGHPPP
jgi:hypothetical protein